MFPKVRSADHFWSAGIFNLVRENENRSYFAIKRVSYVEKLPILWSAEDFLEILGSAKFFYLFYGPQAKKVWETLG